VAIESFACADTERLFRRERVKAFSPALQRSGLRKLLMLHAAVNVADLSVPPGNRLESLAGDREGQYSIRVNDQWRLCFPWEGHSAYDVEIVDYH